MLSRASSSWSEYRIYDCPYTGTSAPRVTVFCGEARKRMIVATSWRLGHLEKSALGIALRLAGVCRIDGTTAFTQIFSAASSSARFTVSEATAAFDAA